MIQHQNTLDINEEEKPAREIIKNQICRRCNNPKIKLYRDGICEDCLIEFELK